MVTCKICNSESNKIFTRKILNKYDINYFQCSKCGFIQTDEPYWLEEAYQHVFNIEDTGIVRRNILFAKRTAGIIFFLFDKNASFVDYGGGTGLFVRLMRDYGFDFYWNDPYSQNIFSRGFEYDPEKILDVELVTAFECFEHFTEPIKEIERLLSISHSILFSTVPFETGTPNPDTWEYYSFSTGQHISFFSLSSLNYIAQKYHLYLCTNKKSFHLFTQKPISNYLFNFLLKFSVISMPMLIKPCLRSKTYSDNKTVLR